jgi:predicted DNA-binding protein (UPF0251 family)
MTGIRSRMSTTSSFGVGGNERDDCGALGGGISGASESFCCSRLLADLLPLIGSGIVGSMPLSRTQQQTADLFQAAGAQESCRTPTPARLTSAQQSAAVVSAAEELSSRHVLPRDLSNALKQLDDGELDRLLAATRHELQRRGKLLTSAPVIRPTTHRGTEQRASDQSTKSPERRQPEEPNVALTQGQVNAVRATFKAGITPSRIARQFGISQSHVRKVLASEPRRSGKRR